MILAIGNSGSYEVEAFQAVVRVLKSRGHDVILFKQDKCLEGEFMTFQVSAGKAAYYLIIDGVAYNPGEFSALWYMHPHLPKQLLEYEPAKYRQFIHKQFYSMRESLWSMFRKKKWINDPWKCLEAENKIYQLGVAADLGFLIPDTLITSDPKSVLSFHGTHPEGIVVKTLGASPILGEVIFTNVVTEEHLQNIDSLKFSPSIFQSLVKKDYELRVTVVGEKFFSAKIYSQEDPGTAVDWRAKPKLNDFEVQMESTSIPRCIEEKILQLMDRLGLKYGCIDMIVTPTGDYVFLEINPNGQWYFVQLRTEAAIAEAIANLLV